MLPTNVMQPIYHTLPLCVARQVSCTMLSDLHPHNRDGCITFVADTHVYYIKGVASMGRAARPAPCRRDASAT